MVSNLAEERDEDQEMIFGYLLHVVDRPTGCASKALDVDRDNVPCLSHNNDVYGLLVSKGQAGITTKPMKHGEDVKLGSQVGVVCRHLFSENIIFSCKLP